MEEQRQAILDNHRNLIESLHDKLERVREDPSADHLRELAEYLEYDLLPHAEAERRSLYPALEPLIGSGGHAAADLDHEFIRRVAGQITKTVESINPATATERTRLLQYLDRIGSSLEALLIARLEKEEQIYLPLLSRFIPEKHREAILAQIRSAGRGVALATEAAAVAQPAPAAPPPPAARPEVGSQEHRRLLPADGRPIASLAEYERVGGLAALRHAHHLNRDQVIGEISRSGLRGRGGAGFPTGSKWSAVLEGSGARYVCCNGAEGEPGTFKDRWLLYLNPYQVIEGLLIAAQTVGAPRAFFCIKRSFAREIERVRVAVEEFRALGLTSDVDVQLVLGPEEYLFGEEKALLEVVEGNLPLPRVLPPYLEGLFRTATDRNPALVNNVETLANIPHILRNGADWFRRVGTADSPGTMIFTVCGDVMHQGCYELALGTPLRALIEHFGGGVSPGRRLKAIFPGCSNGVLTPADFDAPMDFGGMTAAGSGLGSAGFIVYDDTACIVAAALALSRFLYVESCNQCPPCKFGTGEITAYLERLENGVGSGFDMETALARTHIVARGNRCALPVGERVMIQSVIGRFADEFRAHFNTHCPLPRKLPIPKLVSYDPQHHLFTYDERQARKQPDWTYEE